MKSSEKNVKQIVQMYFNGKTNKERFVIEEKIKIISRKTTSTPEI